MVKIKIMVEEVIYGEGHAEVCIKNGHRGKSEKRGFIMVHIPPKKQNHGILRNKRLC